MVKFSEDFRNRMLERLNFYEKADGQGVKRDVEVTVVKHDNLLSEASTPSGDITWFSDEPRAQGGSGRGVSPLAYFLSSMGMCQMVHYAEYAAAKGLAIESLAIRIWGRFSVSHPRGFEEIRYDVEIVSPENREVIRWLAAKAEEDCFVTQTIKKACKVGGKVVHNGEAILEL
ncbi:MAG: OsmC family protein [Nitrososphaerota archaeon]